VGDLEQAVLHARKADEPDLAAALLLEAQVRVGAGDLPTAGLRLDAACALLEGHDLAMSWKRFTIQADLASAEGRLADALLLYVRSLREAERRSNETQILFDLTGVAAADAVTPAAPVSPAAG